MLDKAKIDHLLRAAAAIVNVRKLVMVGTGAVIATARQIPLSMMLTNEVDLYVEGDDTAADQLSAAIGEGSSFHRHFGYYVDGVGPETAIIPSDWKSRAVVYAVAGHAIEALCPSASDIAVAKLCAFRDKDVEWLRAALQSRLVTEDTLRALSTKPMPSSAPPAAEIERRLSIVTRPAA